MNKKDNREKTPLRRSDRIKKIKEDKEKNKYNQQKITFYFTSYANDVYQDTKILGYNDKTGDWHCIICGENMGKTNSRQLCGKGYCYNE